MARRETLPALIVDDPGDAHRAGRERRTEMPLHITWADIAVRLVSALIAAAILGYNRGEHGKAAGLRTTMLVCLAAALAMAMVNILLPLAGRSPDSFVTTDLMRLPLGILTGVGFIGGGAILRRGNLVT